jgi:hypothetical protein
VTDSGREVLVLPPGSLNEYWRTVHVDDGLWLLLSHRVEDDDEVEMIWGSCSLLAELGRVVEAVVVVAAALENFSLLTEFGRDWLVRGGSSSWLVLVVGMEERFCVN